MHPSPNPLALGFILLGVVCASCLREERREVRDLYNLSKIRRMFEWIPHLVDS
jgi:hypothetical protein